MTFMAIYLAVGVHSAPVALSISNDKLTLEIPRIEDVWDGLSKGKKNYNNIASRATQSTSVYVSVLQISTVHADGVSQL